MAYSEDKLPSGLDAKATPVDADVVIVGDSADSGRVKKTTWSQLKAVLKTYNDTLYAAVLGADDNYVTDAEKVVIGNTSGTNTGDQDLSGYVETTGNETIAGVKTFSSFPVTPSSAPSTDYQSANKKYVDDNAGGAPEGTVVKSTGETGAVKYLREDGDGTCSWQVPAGSGDVSKVGTPVNNQVGVWTGDGTIEGDTALTFDTTTDTLSTVVLTASGAVTGSNLSGTNTGDNAVSTSSATVSSGSGAPSSTPTKVGDIYTDTTNDLTYMATGTAASTDWKVQAAGTAGTPAKGSLLLGDGTDSFDELVAGTNDQIFVYDSGETLGGKKVDLDSGINFIIDGGGEAITTGIKGYVEIPFDCTVESATALADQSGSIVVDLWKDTYTNYPPTDADSITASAPVTISTATKSQDSTLTGWTKTFTKGDILGYNVDSITTCERVTVSLKVRRNF